MLTAKQENFVELLTQGSSQSSAYKGAYDTQNMSDKSVWEEASRLRRHPKVSTRILQLEKEKEAVSLKLKELGVPNEQEYRDMYSQSTGKDLSANWEFYMAFNMFKIAAICQGILGRVRDGTAARKHAEERGMTVYPLSEAAWSTIEENFLK